MADYLRAVHPVNKSNGAQKQPVVETSHMDSSSSSEGSSSESEPMSPQEHRASGRRKQSQPVRNKSKGLHSDELLRAKGVTKETPAEPKRKSAPRRRKTKQERAIEKEQKQSYRRTAIPRAPFVRLLKRIMRDPAVNRTESVNSIYRGASVILQDVAEAYLTDLFDKAGWIAGNVGKRVTVMRQDMQAVQRSRGLPDVPRHRNGLPQV